MRLDEEVLRNENLERTIRDMEYELIKTTNSFERKVKELEHSNSQLEEIIQ